MSKVNIFFAEGFEEVEALTTVDLLRRAGIEVCMVSVTDKLEVTGSNGIMIRAEKMFSDISEADGIILPGGMPGTLNLKAHKELAALINRYNDEGKLLAAICAAPTVYGEMKLLVGRHATCYPGMEAGLIGAEALEDSVVIDDHFITSRGVGTAINFALAIIGYLLNDEAADKIASAIVYER